MIFSLRVFGNLLTITIASGVAIGPIEFLMCFMRSARSSSEGEYPEVALCADLMAPEGYGEIISGSKESMI